jgi:DNA polymerase
MVRTSKRMQEWSTVAEEAAGCERCPLYARATQTVFGQGPVPARAMLVGEQPGDKEDLAGQPFVGPAGRVLDEALADAGVDREQVYVTNAVKHFKWTPRGKRRIHQRPERSEIEACRHWFDVELDLVRPTLLMPLGATAAQALLGPAFRVTKARGLPVDSDLAALVVATVHPSSILRGPPEDRDKAKAAFTADLRSAFDHLARLDA